MNKLTRRDLLAHGGALGVVAVLGGAGCGKSRARPLSCTDTTGLSAADMQVRTALNYQDMSPDPAKKCHLCLQFIEPAEGGGACGTCKVVKGPINPQGSCKSFAPRPT